VCLSGRGDKDLAIATAQPDAAGTSHRGA